MSVQNTEAARIVIRGGHTIIHVPGGRGDELRIHLESHGIHSNLVPGQGGAEERLALEGDVDLGTLQAILDQWER